MDISEMRKKKREVETQIHNLLQELEDETGMDVERVTITRSGIVHGFGEPPMSKVEISLKI